MSPRQIARSGVLTRAPIDQIWRGGPLVMSVGWDD
jgi:hypothetical protein